MKKNNIITGICFTKIDNVVCPVKNFCSVPHIGDKVTIIYKGKERSLGVISVTHSEENTIPFIIVELGLRDKSIREWIRNI